MAFYFVVNFGNIWYNKKGGMNMNEIQYSIFEKEILKKEKIGLIILNCISVLCFAASISFLFIDNGIYASVTFILLSILITLISILISSSVERTRLFTTVHP